MIRLTSILVTVSILLGGCQKNASEPAPAKLGVIAVVGVGEDNPYWPVIRATAKRTFDNLEATGLSIRIEAPPTSSINAQRKLLEQLEKEGVRGVCVQVTDDVALKSTLESLADQGVQVTTMFGTIESSKPINRIEIDDEAVGRAVATALIEVVGGDGNIAILHADSVGKSFADRRKAFERQMSAQPEIKILLQYDCEAAPKKARKILRNTMARYPRLAGWAVMGNWPLVGRENEESVLPEGCRMVAVDPMPEVWPAFSRGEIDAMVAGNYVELVERAVTDCVGSVLNGNRATSPAAVGVRTVTRDDLDQFKRDWAEWSDSK